MVDTDATLSGIERTEFTEDERRFSWESLLDWIGGGVEIGKNIDGVRSPPPRVPAGYRFVHHDQR